MPSTEAIRKRVAPISVPSSRLVEAIARDELLDRLQLASLDEVLDQIVDATFDVGTDASPAHRRQCRNLATIYTKNELKALYASTFRRLLIYPPATRESEDFGGAEPISGTSILIGIGVGVVGSLIAAAIYDWATDEEYTTYIEVNGATIEIVIDSNGHIVSQRIVDGGSR